MVVDVKKWSPFLDSGAESPIFWHLKTGTFGESARFQVLKNGTSDAETKKRRPLLTLTIPQNGGIHVRFVPLPLLVGFKLILENCIFWTVLEPLSQ